MVLRDYRRLHEVSSALELPDESREMIVLKSYLLELEIRLGEIFPGCHFDLIYDPTEPSKEDVELLSDAKMAVESQAYACFRAGLCIIPEA
jgi:hypothetical protein